MKKIKIIIEKSSDSFGAYSENVPGVYGAGDTLEECKKSILDAIETLEELVNCPKELKEDYTLIYKFAENKIL